MCQYSSSARRHNGAGIGGKISDLFRKAREDIGVAGDSIYALLFGDPDQEEDYIRGMVGAMIINDIRLELKAIRKGLSNGRSG